MLRVWRETCDEQVCLFLAVSYLYADYVRALPLFVGVFPQKMPISPHPNPSTGAYFGRKRFTSTYGLQHGPEEVHTNNFSDGFAQERARRATNFNYCVMTSEYDIELRRQNLKTENERRIGATQTT